MYTVEASISQKLRISHLAEAVLMVYLTGDCTTILSSLHMWCCNSNTCCSHTKNLQASFFPVNTVEASVSQKMRISHLAAAVLMVCSTVIIALLCEFTYVMLLFKLVLFKHKKLFFFFFSFFYCAINMGTNNTQNNFVVLSNISSSYMIFQQHLQLPSNL